MSPSRVLRPVSVSARKTDGKLLVSWEGQWFKGEPAIDIRLPGFPEMTANPGQAQIEIGSTP